MCRTVFVLLKCTIQGGPKVDVLLIAFLHLWLKFWKGNVKYCIVPVRKLFYFHHCFACSVKAGFPFHCAATINDREVVKFATLAF